jgi:GT2 family glycosyltransferase
MVTSAERGLARAEGPRAIQPPSRRARAGHRPACSVVVRCYNEERHIGRLLAGISRQTLTDVEVILVDSGSTDDTLQVASQYPVRLVQIRPEDFSFGRALNLGFEAASSDVVVAASAHVYPTFTDWLDLLTAPLRDHRVSLCYGRQRGDHRTRFSEHRVFSQWFPELSTRNQDSAFCNNANVAVRRSTWRLHPYDESLTGLEDLAWATAARARGERIAYCAEAEVAHVHEESARAVFNRYRREAIALSTIAPHERLTPFELMRLIPTHIAADWLAAIRAGCFARSFWDIPLFRLAQFLGTYRGSRDAPASVPRLKQRFYYPARREPPARLGSSRPPALSSASSRWIEYGEVT